MYIIDWPSTKKIIKVLAIENILGNTLRTCGTIWETHWEPINPTTPSPSPKEKNWAPWVEVGSPHWLPRIFMPTFLWFLSFWA
jgi:hypothetical protein